MIAKDGRETAHSDNAEGASPVLPPHRTHSPISLPQRRIAWKASERKEPVKEGHHLRPRDSGRTDVFSPAFVVSVVGSGALCFAIGSEALYPYFAGGFVLEGVLRLMKRDKILLSVCWTLGLFTASLVFLARKKGGKDDEGSGDRVAGRNLDLGGAMRQGRQATILSLGTYLLALGIASWSILQQGEVPMLW